MAEDAWVATPALRHPNKTFLRAVDHQLRVGCGINLALFIQRSPPRPLGPHERRHIVMVEDPLSGETIPRSLIRNSKTEKQWFELARHVIDGEVQDNILHTVADCGSIGDPGFNWFFRKCAAKGSQLWDRPHRVVNDWLAALTEAGLHLGRYEWGAVLSLRKGPWGKQANHRILQCVAKSFFLVRLVKRDFRIPLSRLLLGVRHAQRRGLRHARAL